MPSCVAATKPLHVNTPVTITVTSDLRAPATYTELIRTWEEGKEFGWARDTWFVQALHWYRVEADEQRTGTTFVHGEEMGGYVTWIMSGSVVRDLEEGFGRMDRGLKRACEEEAWRERKDGGEWRSNSVCMSIV